MRRRILCALVGLHTLVIAACHTAGPYSHSRIYEPTSDEEKAIAAARPYDAASAAKSPDQWRGRQVWLFGVVTHRSAGPGGATDLAVSIRSLGGRNACTTNDEDSCRVTVTDREAGRVHVLVKLGTQDELGEKGVGLGSLLRVAGAVGQEVDPTDGSPVLRANFYRHWPRDAYVLSASDKTSPQ